jgi:hypothetical protein
MAATAPTAIPAKVGDSRSANSAASSGLDLFLQLDIGKTTKYSGITSRRVPVGSTPLLWLPVPISANSPSPTHELPPPLELLQHDDAAGPASSSKRTGSLTSTSADKSRVRRSASSSSFSPVSGMFSFLRRSPKTAQAPHGGQAVDSKAIAEQCDDNSSPANAPADDPKSLSRTASLAAFFLHKRPTDPPADEAMPSLTDFFLPNSDVGEKFEFALRAGDAADLAPMAVRKLTPALKHAIVEKAGRGLAEHKRNNKHASAEHGPDSHWAAKEKTPQILLALSRSSATGATGPAQRE